MGAPFAPERQKKMGPGFIYRFPFSIDSQPKEGEK